MQEKSRNEALCTPGHFSDSRNGGPVPVPHLEPAFPGNSEAAASEPHGKIKTKEESVAWFGLS